jgi:DNA-directed RNA polymerase specialized sigma24 family protein
MSRTTDSKKYLASAEREPGWWIIRVPELDLVTQARRIGDIQRMATDVVAAWLDVDPCTVNVEIEGFTPPSAVIDQMERAKRLLTKATREQEEAGRLASDAVRVLVDELGLTLREAAEILGVSHQRVAQLRHRTKGVRASQPNALLGGSSR